MSMEFEGDSVDLRMSMSSILEMGFVLLNVSVSSREGSLCIYRPKFSFSFLSLPLFLFNKIKIKWVSIRKSS